MCQQQGVQQESWSSGLTTVETCGLVHDKDSPKPAIYMSYVVYCSILAMCKHMGTLEWLGYLTGKKGEEGNYSVTGVLVPEQEVTGTSVDEIGEVETSNIIGTVHSHHNMGAFFSGTDNHFIGSNHEVMVVFGGNTTKQQIRRHLPCGAYISLEADLLIFGPNYKGAASFIEHNKDKIKEKKIVYPRYYSGLGCNYVNVGGRLIPVEKMGDSMLENQEELGDGWY